MSGKTAGIVTMRSESHRALLSGVHNLGAPGVPNATIVALRRPEGALCAFWEVATLMEASRHQFVLEQGRCTNGLILTDFGTSES